MKAKAFMLMEVSPVENGYYVTVSFRQSLKYKDTRENQYIANNEAEVAKILSQVSKMEVEEDES